MSEKVIRLKDNKSDVLIPEKAGQVSNSITISTTGGSDAGSIYNGSSPVTISPKSIGAVNGFTISLPYSTTTTTKNLGRTSTLTIESEGVQISSKIGFSGFASYSHNHDNTYLKLTGGTLTGELNASTNVNITGNAEVSGKIKADLIETIDGSTTLCSYKRKTQDLDDDGLSVWSVGAHIPGVIVSNNSSLMHLVNDRGIYGQYPIIDTLNLGSYCLPISGGTVSGNTTFSKPVTFSSKINVDLINSQNSSYTLLSYKQTSGVNGSTGSRWTVGATDTEGVIRSNSNDLKHYRGSTEYTIIDTYNLSSNIPVASFSTSKYEGGCAWVRENDGGLEIGNFIDFHTTQKNGDNWYYSDFNTRITCTNDRYQDGVVDSTNIITLGTGTGHVGLMTYVNSNWCLTTPQGSATDYIRTTENGLLPYASDKTNGKSSLGNSSNPFKEVYTKTIKNINPTTGGINTITVGTGTGTIGLMTYLNSYYTLKNPEGSTTLYIRTPSLGLLPYSANSTNGVSSLGNSTNPFNVAHIKNIYTQNLTCDYLLGSSVYGLNIIGRQVFSSDSLSGSTQSNNNIWKCILKAYFNDAFNHISFDLIPNTYNESNNEEYSFSLQLTPNGVNFRGNNKSTGEALLDRYFVARIYKENTSRQPFPYVAEVWCKTVDSTANNLGMTVVITSASYLEAYYIDPEYNTSLNPSNYYNLFNTSISTVNSKVISTNVLYNCLNGTFKGINSTSDTTYWTGTGTREDKSFWPPYNNTYGGFVPVQWSWGYLGLHFRYI